ncbi:MAG TPA: hypothetical protein PLH02_03125 [Bacillota bacterium]|nr:hypothetical protein [Bacillota bacterium]HPJ85959.1 hypothetical protein [Bacillota bacterium]HPQ61853.1 hypothetical protein [Bacillota bacterium]
MGWLIDATTIIGTIVSAGGLGYAYIINKKTKSLKDSLDDMKHDVQFDYLYKDSLIKLVSIQKSLDQDNYPVEKLSSELTEQLTILSVYDCMFIDKMNEEITNMIKALKEKDYGDILSMLNRLIGYMKNPKSLKEKEN